MAKKPERAPKKSECPITKEKFFGEAVPLTLSIAGQTQMEPTQGIIGVKEFSTGSFGWHFSGKIVIEVDGVPLKVQVSMNLIVVGSKEAK